MASLDESDELASLKAEIDRLRSELDENRALVQSLGLEGERAKGILEVAADGILTIDESGLIEYVNPAISQIFGFDAEELIGQNVRLLMPAPHEKAHDGYLENYRPQGRSSKKNTRTVNPFHSPARCNDGDTVVRTAPADYYVHPGNC